MKRKNYVPTSLQITCRFGIFRYITFAKGLVALWLQESW
jgi:hypothetical protein